MMWTLEDLADVLTVIVRQDREFRQTVEALLIHERSRSGVRKSHALEERTHRSQIHSHGES